jgi:hypothetical protein
MMSPMRRPERARAVLLASCGTPPPDPGEPRTYHYVVSWLAPPVDQRGVAIGVDLDGEISTGLEPESCDDVADRVSPTGTEGVDDALVDLVPTLSDLLGECGASDVECVEAFWAREIREGDLALVVEVAGVSSFADDGAVEVRLHAARLASCAASERCPPRLDGGKVEVLQDFVLERALGPAFEGAIEGGVLRASGGAIAWTFAAGEELPFERVAIEARLDGGRLEGALAGAAGAADLASVAESMWPGLGVEVERIVGPLADLDPSVGDPRRCEVVSGALAIEAVAARVP